MYALILIVVILRDVPTIRGGAGKLTTGSLRATRRREKEDIPEVDRKPTHNITWFLLGFVTGIRREGRRNYENKKTDMHKELYTAPVDSY